MYQRVTQKIEKDRRVKKYGVPMSSLKASNIVLLRNSSIEFIFGLKEQKVG